MAEYRFCNVRREDDKVTKWIHNWLRPWFDDPNLPFAAGLARMVNLPETLDDLTFPDIWDSEDFIDTIARRKATGVKVWTSAYMITGGYSTGGEPKEVIIARVLTNLHDQLNKNPIDLDDNLESAEKKLAVPGIGTFLRGQIIADLKMPYMPLEFANDYDTWCGVGPGSTAGLNYLFDRPQKAIGEAQFRKEVSQVRDIIQSETGVGLCAQNTQNVLCEFSKYVRTKYYGGKPKSKYKSAP